MLPPCSTKIEIYCSLCLICFTLLMEMGCFVYENATGYLKNHWTKHRSVRTHFYAFLHRFYIDFLKAFRKFAEFWYQIHRLLPTSSHKGLHNYGVKTKWAMCCSNSIAALSITWLLQYVTHGWSIWMLIRQLYEGQSFSRLFMSTFPQPVTS